MTEVNIGTFPIDTKRSGIFSLSVSIPSTGYPSSVLILDAIRARGCMMSTTFEFCGTIIEVYYDTSGDICNN